MAFRLVACLLLVGLLATVSPVTAQESGDGGQPEVEPEPGLVEPASAVRVAPIGLKIPMLGVDAAVLPVGLADDGAMDIPPDPDTVAWWSLGYGTGEPGNVVLAAHVDWGGQPRVFGLLDRLTEGSSVVVVDELAREFWYEVSWVRVVAAEGAAMDEIFGGSDHHELTLITCGGVFDRARHEYPDRVIVRAQKV
jgi:LPXTG-site transpeptidase (sortase) family protein